MPTFLRTLVAALALSASIATVAHASDDQLSIMMDDDLLVYRDDDRRFRALQQMKSLGVDTVRVTVLWRIAALGADPSARDIRRLDTARERRRARRQRERFDADNPRTYPTRNWDRYDNVVKDAQRLGLRVLFNVTGPGPTWGHREAPRSRREIAATYKPYASKFRDFVEAVGKRYSGTYRDENGARAALPRVTFWSIWNEPNQAGWLSPQWEPRGPNGTRTPASPGLYRELYHFGRQGLQSSGHGDDTILIGETAPLGSSRKSLKSPMRPGLFLREMMCVRSSGRRYSGASAERRDCGDFRRRGALRATGFAHHPYTRKRAPSRKPRHRDELTMANISELGTLLDELSAGSRGNLPSGLPLFMTEFGYESDAPDPHNGISLNKQAEYNQLGEFLAYINPRVKSQAQFLLRDAGPLRRHTRGTKAYWSTFQSGLFFQRGQPKPAAFAYALPFVAFDEGGGRIGFWGQLRFRPDGAQDEAHIQWRPAGDQPWSTIAIAPTNPKGFFTAKGTTPGPGGDYRAVYLNPASGQVELFSLSTTP